MRIAVVNNMDPFVRGGAEDLADYLVAHLRATGHAAHLLRIPFCYEPAENIYDEMLACRMMEIGDVDLVIGFKFPAYLIQHPNKVLWLVHQYRQAYDMWDSGHSNIANSESGHRLRRTIAAADNECFSSVRRLTTISPVVHKRLKKYNGIDSQILRAPLNGPQDFRVGDYGDYIFCGGRINALKRQHLLVEAMKHVRSNAKLVIAGPADCEADGTLLKKLVEQHGLKSRVRLDIGYHSRQKLLPLICDALACAYIPVAEDSYGYVAMEANQAGKAVITASDAGGVLELVLDGQTGWVCEPNALQLAAAIDSAFEHRQRTIALGQHARQEWLKKELTWERTIERLVA